MAMKTLSQDQVAAAVIEAAVQELGERGFTGRDISIALAIASATLCAHEPNPADVARVLRNTAGLIEGNGGTVDPAAKTRYN